MFLSTQRMRTTKEEFLDNFSLEGEELRDALDKIAIINQWLGGNAVTLDGIKKLLKNWPERTSDFHCRYWLWQWRYVPGCRRLWQTGRALRFQYLGIDANAYTVNHAKAISTAYPTIDYATHERI